MQSGIYEGYVRHRRLTPARHEFRASLFLMYLDLNELSTVFKGRWFWSVERSNVATFRRRDHVGHADSSLDETIRDLVESELGSRPAGSIRLLTHLSYFGYCFNPLSIFFCFDETDERLHSIVAEVSNTPWGERHCYVLNAISEPLIDAQTETSQSSTGKHQFSFEKSFHVSPFMEMDLDYRWNLSGPGPKIVLHTENLRGGDTFFDATLVLERREITTWSLAKVLARYPLMTVQVIANIHWQALRLWWKKVPYVPHPKTCQSLGPVKNSVTLPKERKPT